MDSSRSAAFPVSARWAKFTASGGQGRYVSVSMARGMGKRQQAPLRRGEAVCWQATRPAEVAVSAVRLVVMPRHCVLTRSQLLR